MGVTDEGPSGGREQNTHYNDSKFNVVKDDMSLLGVDIESASKNVGSGTGTVFGTVTNIIKNTVGAGILVLPMAFYQGGFVLGTLVLLVVCLSCAYSFYMIGKACEKSGRYTWDGLIEDALGPRWAGVGAWLVIILCSLALVAYSVIIGMFLQQGIMVFVKEDQRSAFQKSNVYGKVWNYTVLATILIMLPLSFLKNLESLKFTSTAGVAIVCYGTILVIARMIYTFGSGKHTILKAYQDVAPIERKKLLEAFSWGPNGTNAWITILNIIGMLNTMSASSNCHFNGPSFYGDLKSRNKRTLRRITIMGFGLITFLNFVMSYAGYFAFGALGQTGNMKLDDKGVRVPGAILSGLVPMAFLNINNVGIPAGSAWEMSGTILIMVWALALTFSFPLIFNALRRSVYEVCSCATPKNDEDEPRKRKIVTAIGVFSICAVSTILLIIAPGKGADIAFNLFGLISVTAGNAITYILPGVIWIKLNPEKTTWELKGPYFISILGVVFSITGLVEQGKKWIDLFKS